MKTIIQRSRQWGLQLGYIICILNHDLVQLVNIVNGHILTLVQIWLTSKKDKDIPIQSFFSFHIEKWYLYNYFGTTFSLILTLCFYYLSSFFSHSIVFDQRKERTTRLSQRLYQNSCSNITTLSHLRCEQGQLYTK